MFTEFFGHVFVVHKSSEKCLPIRFGKIILEIEKMAFTNCRIKVPNLNANLAPKLTLGKSFKF